MQDITIQLKRATIKTLYAPCPNGYRIPKSGTYGEGSGVTAHPDWSVWSDSGLKSGRTLRNASFFPASGYRVAADGKFHAVGGNLYAWMSNPNKFHDGSYLTSFSAIIRPNSTDIRANSLLTRCIKD